MTTTDTLDLIIHSITQHLKPPPNGYFQLLTAIGTYPAALILYTNKYDYHYATFHPDHLLIHASNTNTHLKLHYCDPHFLDQLDQINKHLQEHPMTKPTPQPHTNTPK